MAGTAGRPRAQHPRFRRELELNTPGDNSLGRRRCGACRARTGPCSHGSESDRIRARAALRRRTAAPAPLGRGWRRRAPARRRGLPQTLRRSVWRCRTRGAGACCPSGAGAAVSTCRDSVVRRLPACHPPPPGPGQRWAWCPYALVYGRQSCPPKAVRPRGARRRGARHPVRAALVLAPGFAAALWYLDQPSRGSILCTQRAGRAPRRTTLFESEAGMVT